MSHMVSRRGFAALAMLTLVGAALSACGKKGAPIPPRDEPSDFPRHYPAPSKYPHPGQGETLQNPPPERQQPSGDGSVTGTPGMYDQ
jgi:predicted small lipoprotein YifL